MSQQSEAEKSLRCEEKGNTRNIGGKRQSEVLDVVHVHLSRTAFM